MRGRQLLATARLFLRPPSSSPGDEQGWGPRVAEWRPRSRAGAGGRKSGAIVPPSFRAARDRRLHTERVCIQLLSLPSLPTALCPFFLFLPSLPLSLQPLRAACLLLLLLLHHLSTSIFSRSSSARSSFSLFGATFSAPFPDFALACKHGSTKSEFQHPAPPPPPLSLKTRGLFTLLCAIFKNRFIGPQEEILEAHTTERHTRTKRTQTKPFLNKRKLELGVLVYGLPSSGGRWREVEGGLGRPSG